ncbi:MAG: serine/threonine protein kinase [Myxococcales bacterium]|nr:serine/threonine protein kinase [Myxococcales bacterium]
MLLHGRYELVRPLGEGGMAGVFLAQDTMLDRQVAIKQLHAQHHDREAVRARFLREARIFARLKHPCVVDIYDVLALDDGGVAMVMEYVEGDDLTRLTRHHPPLQLPPELAALVIAPVVEALVYVHREGVIHRDVKPANILLGRSGVVKLGDFGIARGEEDDALTKTGDFLGTPAYIPPEQARGERVGDAVDQYALGVCLYQLVTAAKPFAAPTTAEVIVRILSDEPTDPRKFAPGLDPAFIGLIQRALSKDPAARFADMEAFQAALLPFVPAVDDPKAVIAALIEHPADAALAFGAKLADQRVEVARAALSAGDRDTAIVEARQALTRSPDHSAARTLLAEMGAPAIAALTRGTLPTEADAGPTLVTPMAFDETILPSEPAPTAAAVAKGVSGPLVVIISLLLIAAIFSGVVWLLYGQSTPPP